MGFLQSVKTCFRKYAVFCGPNVVQTFVYDGNGGGVPVVVRYSYNSGWLGAGFLFATLLPWLAVSWRRIQDSGRAGYWLWLTICTWLFFTAFSFMSGSVATTTTIGFVGFFALLIINTYFYTSRSDPSTNEYGLPWNAFEEVFE